jgi:hypothetical protein
MTRRWALNGLLASLVSSFTPKPTPRMIPFKFSTVDTYIAEMIRPPVVPDKLTGQPARTIPDRLTYRKVR